MFQGDINTMKPLMLRIDLTRQIFQAEEIPPDVIRKYIGGRGLGAYYLYQFVPAKIDPLGPQNHLIFSAGLASGTGLYFSSKACLNTKSPQTRLYLDTVTSGLLAEKIRQAGFWMIDIQGRAQSPTYLVINNQEVQFKDASAIWGLETARGQKEMLQGAPAGREAATVGIGPAGEQLLTYAGVFCDGELYRCAGRGGAGSVMGSKKLKGLVVLGDGTVEPVDKARFAAVNAEILKRTKEKKEWADRWRRYETAADLEVMNGAGLMPTNNWQRGQFSGYARIDKSTTPLGWPEKGRSCGKHCLTPGCREVIVAEGPYKGAHCDVEWEAVYAFGCNNGIDKMDAIIAANQLCDEFGIDTISTGLSISFATECFEKGLLGLPETGGLELKFGDDQALITSIKKIIQQDEFGKFLSKGTKWMSQQIPGSADFAMHVKGLELGGYECRGLNGQSIAFAVSNRGGCHHAYGLPARAEIFDGTRLNIKGKGEYVKQKAIHNMLRDSVLVCMFTQVFDNQILAEAISAVHGEPLSLEEVSLAGERIMAMERLFNVREGISRKDDTLPARLLKEPKPDGPTKGAVAPLKTLLDEYYTAVGYDLETGNPTDATLKRLGIEK
jgi:aldehyde:ferredoxin oxidoreductase